MQMLPLCFAALLAVCTDGASLPKATCDPKTGEISGGSYKVLKDGSVLMYECPEGKYPYPVPIRNCRASGQWSAMRNLQKRLITKAECRDVQCPAPTEFEHGDFEPRQPRYNVSQELRFHCYGGYTLRGSHNRTCLPNGKWSGETAVCDDGAGHCPNPGVPIGTWKEGTEYRIEKRVRYHCHRGLALVGSAERTCLESGEWSGSEPACRDRSTYDTPEEVSAAFLSSLTDVVEVSDPDKTSETTGKRRIKIEPGGSMNIYVVLDASESIGKDFEKAQNVIIKLIEKVASYDVSPKYGIVTYATEAKEVVKATDENSNDAAWVIDQLKNITYKDHQLKPGTNTKAGLDKVYHQMLLEQEEEKRRGEKYPRVSNTTRHVIILMTDGNYNMGGSPVSVIRQIKDFLDIGRDYNNPRDDYLDIYVFGVGSMIDTDKLNELATHKANEHHVFKVKNIDEMQDVFEKMIDESAALYMCGLAKEFVDAPDEEKNPWHVTIKVVRPGKGTETCKGAIVSPYYIITAAHCFDINDEAHWIQVDQNKRIMPVAELHSHPKYNIRGLENAGIAEFYDYDVALVKLQKKITFSAQARPICLPCTAGATRAMRKPHPGTTCHNHMEELLPVGNINALFVSEDKKKHLLRKNLLIKNGEKKSACEADAKNARIYKNVTDVSQVVTERFLCSGGTEPQKDPNTCKGDSGGPLIVTKKLRYIQVGVISWGVFDVCKGERVTSPAHARDFHLNLFKVLPWLREKLKDEELDFL